MYPKINAGIITIEDMVDYGKNVGQGGKRCMDKQVVRVQNESIKGLNNALSWLTKLLAEGHCVEDCPWIVFLLANTEYVINAQYVMRLAVLSEIVPVADAPAYCPGIIWDNVGMIRLLDLRVLLGQEDYLSAVKNNKNSGFPMIIVIGLGGKSRGIIVDEIIEMRYLGAFTEVSASRDAAQSRYIKGMAKYNRLKSSAYIIDPESFRTVKFENPDARIVWNERIDIGLVMGAEMAERSGVWLNKF